MPTFKFNGNSGTLGNRLGSKPTSEAYQAHHIIPSSLVNAGTELRDTITEAYTFANENFDINDVSNGIWLPESPGVSSSIHRTPHRAEGGGLHDFYNSHVGSILDFLIDEYDDFLIQKRSDIKRKYKGAKETNLLKDLEKNTGEGFKKYIDKAMDSLKFYLGTGARTLFLDGKLAMVNYNDPDLKSSYILSNPEIFNNPETASDQYDDIIQNGSPTDRAVIHAFYKQRFEPSRFDVIGNVSFKGVRTTANEDRKQGGDGGVGGNKGSVALLPFSKRQIKEMLEAFKEALNGGKKDPIFIAATALNFLSLLQLIQDLTPDQEFLQEDLIALLKDSLNDIEGLEVEIDPLLAQLQTAAVDTLTDPAFVAGIVARLLLPSYGWAATVVAIVDNFDYILQSIELAAYVFDDPGSVAGAAFEQVDLAISEAIAWLEFFGIEFDIQEDSEGELNFDEVDENLSPALQTLIETQEEWGQSAADIVPHSDDEALEFDGVIRISPDAPLADGVTASVIVDVTEYLRELVDERQLFSEEQQAEFDDLAQDFILFGGLGDDILEGGLGNDAFYGDAGYDLFIGGVGDDYYIGGPGGDDPDRGDTLQYFNNPKPLINANGEEETFAFKKLTLTIGETDTHIKVTKEYKAPTDGTSAQRPSDTDHIAGIETIALSGEGDEVVFRPDVDKTKLQEIADNLILDGSASLEEGDLLNFSEVSLPEDLGIKVRLADEGQLPGDAEPGSAEWDEIVFDVLNFEDVISSENEDDLKGNGQRNAFFSRGGNDTIDGGGSHDELHAGLGDDRVLGGEGADFLFDAGATERFEFDLETETAQEIRERFEQYQDQVFTAYNHGDDTLFGGSGSDFIVHSGGNDTVYGGAGHDAYTIVEGARPSDGPGNPGLTIVFEEETEGTPETYFGNDLIFENTGLARAVFEGLDQSDVTIKYDFESNAVGQLVFDFEPIFIAWYWDPNVVTYDIYETTGTVEIIVNATGSSLTIEGVRGEYVAVSNGSVGPLTPTPSIVVPMAIEFDDGLLDWSTALLDPSSNGTRFLRTDLSANAFNALTAFDDEREAIENTIDGSSSDDQLFGSAAPDLVTGGLGDDVIRTGNSSDTLIGGGGADTLYGGFGVDTASYVGALARVVANLETGGTDGEALGDIYDSIENLEGSSFDDGLIGDDGDNILTGGAGDDGLIGERGDDLIYGGDGDDYLEAGLGFDSLYGGLGNDLFASESGDSSLFGGEGDDHFITKHTFSNLPGEVFAPARLSHGQDIIDGGAGNDTVEFDWHRVTVDLAAGFADFSESTDFTTDVVLPPEQAAWLRVSDGFVVLKSIENVIGSEGRDTIYGDHNNNTIDGDRGSDTIYGAGGDDFLIEGSAGSNVLYGGSGQDTARIERLSTETTLSYTDGALLIVWEFGTFQVHDDIELIQFNDVTLTFAQAIAPVLTEFAIIGDYQRIDEGLTTTVDLFANDLAMPGDPIALTKLDGQAVAIGDVIRLASGATVEILADGQISLDQAGAFAWLDEGEAGSIQLTYSATDSTGIEKSTDVALIIDGQASDPAAIHLEDGFIIAEADPDNATMTRVANFDIARSVVIYDDDWIDPNAIPASVQIEEINGDTFIIFDGDDAIVLEDVSFEAWKHVSAQAILGTAAGETLNGTDADELIAASGGNDVINTGNGNNVVLGGAGNDNINFGAGDNLAFGGAGSDRIGYGSGSNTIYGGAGEDTLYGGTGNDSLYGGASNDDFVGSLEADLIDGGEGGTDYVIYSASESGITINLITGKGYGGLASGDTFVDIEGIDATNHDDVFIGTSGADQLIARNGNDIFYGGGGDGDVVDFGSGIDTVDFSWATTGAVVRMDQTVSAFGAQMNYADVNGERSFFFNGENVVGSDHADQLHAGTQTRKLEGKGGDDSLFGSSSNDNLLGGSGDDFLGGGSGSDTLEGGAGDDRLEGGFSNDTLYGGGGNDTFVIRRQNYIDDLYGGTGEDTIDASAEDGQDENGVPSQLGIAITVDLDAENWTGFSNPGDVFAAESVEHVSATQLDDELVGSSGANRLAGNGGQDTIDGGAGDDTIIGGAGTDRLTGGAGDDSFEDIAAHLTGDTIVDFSAGDVIRLLDATFTASDLSAGAGSDLVLQIDTDQNGSTDVTLTLEGLTSADLSQLTVSGSGSDTVLSMASASGTAPSNIQLSSSTVDENSAAAVIGTLSATDPDPGDVVTFAVDDDRFEVAGNELRLKPGEALDFEPEATVDLVVTATDLSGLNGQANITLTVTDINEVPEDVAITNAVTELSETIDTSARIKLADLSVLDDALGTNVVSLSGADAALFEIDGLELFLAAGAALDHGTAASHTVTVEVDDTSVGGTPDASRSFTLNVAPNQAPTDIALSASSVDENAAGGVIGILSTTDPDPNGTHSYTVDDARFEVVGDQLQLKAGEALNFETEGSVGLIVTSTDQGSLSTQKAFTVTVGDVNEAPEDVVISNPVTELSESADTSAAIKLADLSVIDDALGTNALSLSGADAAMFEIIGSELFLKAGAVLDHASATSHSVTIEADDATVGGTPDASQSFTLSVNQDTAPTPALGEAGSVTVAQTGPDQWHSVSFAQAITDAIVVMGPVSMGDGEAAITRVRNVTDTGFEFQIDEWNYQDGVHGTETVGWLAVSEGTHTLASGQTLVAGSSSVGTGFSTVTTGATLTDAIIFAEVTSVNETDAVTPRMRNVTSTSFQVQIEEEEALGPHVAEEVSWIALEAGSGSGIEAVRTGDNFDERVDSFVFNETFATAPVLLMDIQSNDGGDTSAVRHQDLTATGFSAFLQEEQSANSEVKHTNETAAWLALEEGLLV